MNNFLFITHITPVHKRSSLRQSLIDQYFRALRAQQYDRWNVLILGEEEKEDGTFHFVHLPDVPREEKFSLMKTIYKRDDVNALISSCDYVVKLDDDDLVSPKILQELSGKDFDCCYDRAHTFFDISSGTITQQARPWIASTCVHKREHAFSAWDGPGASPLGNLLYSDHSKSWHVFYRDKRCIVADPEHPVYLRVLSPTSITSGAKENGSPAGIAEIDMTNYFAYLKNFGYWEKASTNDFNAYLPALRDAWREFSTFEWKPIPGLDSWSRFVDKLSHLWRTR